MGLAAVLGFNIFATDNASASFRAVARSSDDLHSHLDRVSAIGEKMGNGIKLGAVAAGAGLISAGTIGLKTAANLEQANIGFTTMLGSGQKAKDFLGRLQKFAADTPFDFPDLVTSSERLLAMGINAKNVIPYMTAIGDAASGLGGGKEKIDELVTALGQMQAKGKIQSDELLQMTEAGVPALKILAAAYHKTTGEMQQMVTDGDVLSDKAIPALIQGLEKGTATTQAFGGMMDKQSHSLIGLFNKLKDNVNMTLSNIMSPAIPSIKKGIDAAANEVQKLGPKIQAGLKTAMAAAGTVGGKIGDALHSSIVKHAEDKLKSLWDELEPAIASGAADVAGDIKDDAKKIGGGIFSGIFEGVKTGDWSKLGGAVGKALSKGLSGAGKLAISFTAAIGGIFEKIDWFSLAMKLGKQIPTLLAGLVTGLLNFDLGGLLSGLADHWFAVLIGVLTLAFAPAKLIDGIGQILARVPFAGPLLKWGLNALVKFSKGLVGKVFGLLGELGGAFIKGFSETFPRIGEAFFKDLELLPTKIGVVAIDLFEKGKAMIKGLGEAILGAHKFVLEAIGKLIGKILGKWVGANKWLLGKGWDLLKGLLGGINKGISPVVNLFRGIGGRIVGWVGNLGGVLVRAGIDLIMGFVRGITSRFSSVKSTLGSLTRKLISWKGPPSTDKKLLVDNGVLVMSGFQKGLESQFPAVRSSLQGFTGSLSGVAQATVVGAPANPVGMPAAGEQRLEDVLTRAFCRAIGEAKVYIDQSGLVRFIRSSELAVGRRA